VHTYGITGFIILRKLLAVEFYNAVQIINAEVTVVQLLGKAVLENGLYIPARLVRRGFPVAFFATFFSIKKSREDKN
jgi:hypothetical protein